MRLDKMKSHRWFRLVRIRLAVISALVGALISGVILFVVYLLDAHAAYGHICNIINDMPCRHDVIVYHSHLMADALVLAWIVLTAASSLVGYFCAPYITKSAELAMENLARTSDAIAHDLRAPLTRLSVRSEMEAAKEGPSSEFAISVASDVQDLLALVNTLLEIAHLEREERDVPCEDVDLAEVAGEAVELFAPLAESAGIELLTTGFSKPIIVNAPRAQLLQVVNNLIDNAIKHTPKGKWVSVRVERTATTAVLIVSDLGRGIPSDELPHVFKKFFRGRGCVGDGNGLGLSLVHAIVNSLGGRISVDSKPDLGASFKIQLPIR